ncbi:hypothetical protein HPG69_004745 [Diceros bicornis minor]|uniref:Uncharacterized protein n=1 Tax=Diceros bicornis minor TaxID=77932 RepID=A0A7J7E5H1_DICBM|nr:hypothetical protein HPG69_004745 [Diceros bicornis minor]
MKTDKRTRPSSAKENAQERHQRSRLQAAPPRSSSGLPRRRKRQVNDITCDAQSFSHVPSLPPPGRPRQTRTRNSASGRRSSLPTMLCGSDLSQRPRLGGE